MNTIPQSHQDLVLNETRAYAYLTTVMADGSPQVTPVWFNTDGEDIMINSAKGRVKDRNMRSRPAVAILITDPANPYYRYMQIRGHVVDITEERALDHINALSLKYEGKPWSPVEGQIRVTYRIRPERVYVG